MLVLLVETNSKICGVYCWTHTPSGRKYVGSSVDCELRRKTHLVLSRRLHTVGFPGQIAKYGAESFTFEILETCAVNERLAREAYHIASLGTLVPNGFNIQKDPTVGWNYTFSEDMRAAMSARAKARCATPEARKALAARVIAFQSTPEGHAANAARLKAYWRTVKARSEQSARVKAFRDTPEGKAVTAATSIRAKARNSTPEARAVAAAKTKAFFATPEGKLRAAAQSEQLKARATPESRAAYATKMKAYFALPGARAAHSLRKKMFFETLEGKAVASAHSARMKAMHAARRNCIL